MKAIGLALSLAFTALACRIELPASFFSGTNVDLTEEAKREETRPLELAPGEVLTLVTDFGRVEVSAAEGAPELRASVSANGRTQEEAAAVLARYELRLERDSSGLRADLVGTPLRVQEDSTEIVLGAHVDFVATVPPGTALTATSGSGDLVTHGSLGNLRLDTNYGKIAIDAAHGDVHAESGSGDVRAARLEGGTVELRSGYGAVRVEEARVQSLTCASGSGDVDVQAAEADELDLSTSYGAVHVARAGGAVRASSGSGDVRLAGVRGAVAATSSYGKVEVEGVFTALEARSGSGDVHARALEGSRIESSWKLESSYGRVVLHVPDGFACLLDAKTAYGDVDCDFPVTTEAGKKKGDNRLRGTIGSGGGAVTLTSGSGDVALKKL